MRLVLAAAAVVGAAVLGARAIVDPLNPHVLLAPTAATRFPIVILADGFTPDEESDFDSAAATIAAQVQAASFYSANIGLFSFTSAFNAAATSGVSTVGFHDPTGATECAIDWDPSTSATIDAVLTGVAHFRVIVIGNRDYHFGCAYDQWIYLAQEAQFYPDVIPHELGHAIGGLKDEYFPDPPASFAYSGPALVNENCWSGAPPPWWQAAFMTATNAPGCMGYTAGVVHAYDDCRMKRLTSDFCLVCLSLMNKAIAPPPPPAAPTNIRIIKASMQPPPPPPVATVRLLVRVNAATSDVAVTSVSEESRLPASTRARVGDIAYEITDGGQTIDTAVVPGDPFEVRSYAGSPAAPHTAARRDSANVVVYLQQATLAALRSRDVAITFYRLSPTARPRQDVTPDALGAMKTATPPQATSFATLTADALRRAVETAIATRRPI